MRIIGRRTRHLGGRGQTLVEFALVLPVFFLLLFGLIDVGRYVYMNSVLSQASREAARLGSVEASWIASGDSSCGTTGGPVCPASVAVMRTHMTDAANRMVTPFGVIATASVYTNCSPETGTPPTGAWTTTTCTNHLPGDFISVRIVMTFTPLTPVGNLVGAITTASSTTMVIN